MAGSHRRKKVKKVGITLLLIRNIINFIFLTELFQLLGKLSSFPLLLSAFISADLYAQIQVLFAFSWSTVFFLLLCRCYSLGYVSRSSVCLYKYLVVLC